MERKKKLTKRRKSVGVDKKYSIMVNTTGEMKLMVPLLMQERSAQSHREKIKHLCSLLCIRNPWRARNGNGPTGGVGPEVLRSGPWKRNPGSVIVKCKALVTMFGELVPGCFEDDFLNWFHVVFFREIHNVHPFESLDTLLSCKFWEYSQQNVGQILSTFTRRWANVW